MYPSYLLKGIFPLRFPPWRVILGLSPNLSFGAETNQITPPRPAPGTACPQPQRFAVLESGRPADTGRPGTMDRLEDCNSPETSGTAGDALPRPRVYARRWVFLLVVSLLSCSNAMVQGCLGQAGRGLCSSTSQIVFVRSWKTDLSSGS